MKIPYVIFRYAKHSYQGTDIDTTSKSGNFSGLSPFLLDASNYGSRTFENLWQYSKVYPEHLGNDGLPNDSWYAWRKHGFENPLAVRYPKGKGAVPLFSYWENERLGYITARKRIYAPIYAELVQKTESFRRLDNIFSEQNVILRDFDGYDYIAKGISLVHVINNPVLKMGHAFVLAMVLTGQLPKCINSPNTEPEQRIL